MLSKLVEMLKRLETETGARVRVSLNAIYPGGLFFRFDFENLHTEISWKAHELENLEAIESAMVREFRQTKRMYFVEKQRGIDHRKMAKMQREYKGPPQGLGG